MASIGHIAVGLAASRAYNGIRNAPTLSSMALWSGLSLLPDADVIGLSLGIAYGSLKKAGEISGDFGSTGLQFTRTTGDGRCSGARPVPVRP